MNSTAYIYTHCPNSIYKFNNYLLLHSSSWCVTHARHTSDTRTCILFRHYNIVITWLVLLFILFFYSCDICNKGGGGGCPCQTRKVASENRESSLSGHHSSTLFNLSRALHESRIERERERDPFSSSTPFVGQGLMYPLPSSRSHF